MDKRDKTLFQVLGEKAVCSVGGSECRIQKMCRNVSITVQKIQTHLIPQRIDPTDSFQHHIYTDQTDERKENQASINQIT